MELEITHVLVTSQHLNTMEQFVREQTKKQLNALLYQIVQVSTCVGQNFCKYVLKTSPVQVLSKLLKLLKLDLKFRISMLGIFVLCTAFSKQIISQLKLFSLFSNFMVTTVMVQFIFYFILLPHQKAFTFEDA